MHPAYSFHTGFSKFGHVRDPGNDSVKKTKKHITGEYLPRTGQEPAVCFPLLPGTMDTALQGKLRYLLAVVPPSSISDWRMKSHRTERPGLELTQYQ